jgi:hypothetical protein
MFTATGKVRASCNPSRRLARTSAWPATIRVIEQSHGHHPWLRLLRPRAPEFDITRTSDPTKSTCPTSVREVLSITA